MLEKKDSINKVGIRPLGTDILVKRIIINTKYQKNSNLITPKTENDGNKRELYDTHPFQATVLRLGKDYVGEIKVGDVVYFIGGDGYPIIWDDKDYIVMKSDRILGIKE